MEDSTHPSTVRISELEFPPTGRFEIAGSGCLIYHAESRFQVRVFSFVVPDGRVSVGDRLEYLIVEFVAHALALNSDAEKGLRTGVSLLFELENHHRMIGRMVEAFGYGVVEPLQWGGSDVGVLNDLGDELHDIQDDVQIHGHLKHPGYAVRVQHVALQVSILI